MKELEEVRKELIEIIEYELERDELKEVDSRFYEEIIEKINDAEAKINAVKDTKIRKLLRSEVYTLKKLLRQLFLIRLRKVIDRLIEAEAIEYEKLTEVEKDILLKILSTVESVLEKKATEPSTSIIEKRHTLVVFLKEYPCILASDGKSYGPFTKEDLVYLPRDDAIRLSKKGVVKIVEVKSKAT